jgi:hypothetical protein
LLVSALCPVLGPFRNGAHPARSGRINPTRRHPAGRSRGPRLRRVRRAEAGGVAQTQRPSVNPWQFKPHQAPQLTAF